MSHASRPITYKRVPDREYPHGTATTSDFEKHGANPSNATTTTTPSPLRILLTQAASVVCCISTMAATAALLFSMTLGTGYAIKRIIQYPDWVPSDINGDVNAIDLLVVLFPPFGALVRAIPGFSLWQAPERSRKATVLEVLMDFALVAVGMVTVVLLALVFRLFWELCIWVLQM
ncbi:hypothetical protein W97_00994 [Coniosporium apollinis CBS 100218]|uniref:Uncharacterized protein n=1 Tax=Coniosporium apollinis (strain CBS 100218) TaxID=1168221 RepID=R7YIR2_CONA1|nr:uncharacterized protein W97_00994 [Coniosporium apollinis CBS 100218]EON61778.1 hypothetical protein W97_00994 [Coniosporium apollinis CBS 100218]